MLFVPIMPSLIDAIMQEYEQQLRLYRGNEAVVFVSCFKSFCSFILGVAPHLEVLFPELEPFLPLSTKADWTSDCR